MSPVQKEGIDPKQYHHQNAKQHTSRKSLHQNETTEMPWGLGSAKGGAQVGPHSKIPWLSKSEISLSVHVQHAVKLI